jgi:hypothetical protein
MRRPTTERTIDLLLRGAGGGSIAALLSTWCWILTTAHVPGETFVLLPLIAIIGAVVGAGLGLFIWLCEYALQRTTGVVLRSLIGACYILSLACFLIALN